MEDLTSGGEMGHRLAMIRIALTLAAAVLSLSLAQPQASRAQSGTTGGTTGGESGAETASADETAPRRGPSGLPLPRFVSLHSDEVNMRTGPGVRYPIDWVYQRQGLPMQIIDEFEAWRRVRDRDGTEGWVHKSMLSGRRTIVIMGGAQALREEPLSGAQVLAYLEPGFIARLDGCLEGWCEVTATSLQGQRYRGWVQRTAFWGVFDGEVVE